jgi:hypothetical protein
MLSRQTFYTKVRRRSFYTAWVIDGPRPDGAACPFYHQEQTSSGYTLRSVSRHLPPLALQKDSRPFAPYTWFRRGHGLSCLRRLSPLSGRKLHLSACSNFRSQLWDHNVTYTTSRLLCFGSCLRLLSVCRTTAMIARHHTDTQHFQMQQCRVAS